MNESESKLVEQVAALARERFAPRAEKHDREGSFNHDNIAELRELGVPGMGLSIENGGLGVSVECQTRDIEEVAYGDPSTAVALNMHLLIADLVAFLPPWPRRNTVLEDIAKNGALICGPGSVPTAELDSRTSGYVFTDDGDTLTGNGKAGFASMSDAASYVLVGGRIDKGEGQEPDVVLSMPDKSTPGLRVLENWDAMGLRGTASHDIVAENLKLPKSEALVIPLPLLRSLQESGQGPGVTQDRARGALGILAIWLGTAQAAFDFSLDYVKHRYGYLAGSAPTVGIELSMRSEQPWAQHRIGEMEHWLETGRIVLYDTVRRLDTPFPDSQEFTRHMVRTVYHLRRMAEEVAMGSMKVCGAHAYVRARPMERIFRDLMGGVVMAWKTDELVQTLGAGALGQPITIVGPAGA